VDRITCQVPASKVLQQKRYAAKRPVGRPAARLRHRALKAAMDHGVELGVDPFDPLNCSLNQFKRRYFAATDKLRLRGGV
jgi:hypothetical protein